MGFLKPSCLKKIDSLRLITQCCLVLAFVLGCSSKEVPPGRPDKKPVHTIVCKYHLQACHLKARGTCSNSYWVETKIRRTRIGGPWGAYSEYTMKFTCK